jgi:non-specific serine/threonine protein kinase/serine/threonine-protein kinase
MLTGHRPIEPPASLPRVEVPRFLRDTEPERPSKYDSTLAGDIDAIVLKALQKNRKDRYRSVEQFVTFIQHYVENRPLPESKLGLLNRCRKFVRRHRAGVLVTCALILSLLAGLVATLYQARIAKRRFKDVRALATSFLFDFDASIAQVKGATDARRLVVQKGLEYLDKLSRESAGDASLQEEIAGAYERLAAIQGNVFGDNLGQYQRAAESYEKAISIRKALLARHPSDRNLQRELGASYLQLADGWFTKGNTKGAIGYYQEGLRILTAVDAAGEQSKAIQSGLETGYVRLCGILLAEGNHAGAIENCQKAIAAAKVLVASNPSDPAQRTALAVAYGQTANALTKDNRPKEGIPYLELASSEFETLAAQQPSNNAYARNVAGSNVIVGNAWAGVGENGKAIAAFQKAGAEARRLIAADSADVRPKITLAVSLLRVAPLLAKEGREPEAIQAGREGLQIFRGFGDRADAAPDDLNNFASFLQEISIPSLRDPRLALVYSKRAVDAVLAAHGEPSLVFLSTLANCYFDAGEIPSAIATAERALAANPPSPGTRDAGVRADLERSLQHFKDSEAKRNGR